MMLLGPPRFRSLFAIFVYVAIGILFTIIFISTENFLPIKIRVDMPGSLEHVPYSDTYNRTKLALLIESRPLPHLTPLLLHFLAVVPPEWPFLFMGSNESIERINRSASIRHHTATGKLEIRVLPRNLTMINQEDVSRVYTNEWFYRALLPAEWLFNFQTDSMICANSGQSLNDWVDQEYTWVGASWGKEKQYGGNGGFSLRRISHVIRLLETQLRWYREGYEDQWLTERLAHMPGTKMATGEEEMAFSVELVPYPKPLGYHTGWSGKLLMQSVWSWRKDRDQIFDYCPELKMLLPMLPEADHEARGCWKDWIKGEDPSTKTVCTRIGQHITVPAGPTVTVAPTPTEAQGAQIT
ncbi:hypothetical protein TWF696_002386 [Orbilia brochopaga]|uniref:DUF5672 domain-containing protein n=1 Tax=Orbilia brochopaga TaxID=3140254 RepID=A0AAV9U5I1_9PEZI